LKNSLPLVFVFVFSAVNCLGTYVVKLIFNSNNSSFYQQNGTSVKSLNDGLVFFGGIVQNGGMHI